MRILTVRQPWAWAIIHGQKDVENRVRNIAGAYRGPVAIHVASAEDADYYTRASGRVAVDAMEAFTVEYERTIGTLPFDEAPWWNDNGAIIGVVDLVDAHKGLAPSRSRFEHVGSCFRSGKPYGACSPWAEPHSWHFELANARPIADPIPFKGALGLRRLDEDMTARILAAIA